MNRFLKRALLNPAFKIVQPLPSLDPDWAKNHRTERTDLPEMPLALNVGLALAGQGRTARPHDGLMICVIRCTESH